MIDDPAIPQAGRPESVPDVSERDLWLAELLLLSDCDRSVRSAQFVVRTAVRAVELARMAGTTAIDELLDARSSATTDKARTVYDRTLTYLRAEQILNQDLPWQG